MKSGRILRKAVLMAAAAIGAMVFTSNVEAVVLDLTAGGTGTINGAIFSTNDQGPTGTGVIRSFVRIQSNKNIEEGYNTDGRPLQFDENNTAQFTRSLVKADLQAVNIGGTDYYKFLLDINQTGANPLLTLTDLEIYVGDAPNLLGFTPGSGFGTHSSLVYDLDAGTDSRIELNYLLNSGSGSGDMFAFIKKGLFNGGSKPYVYLYSRFGDPNANNDGFEEWAAVVGRDTPTAIPLPASVWGGMALMAIIGAAKLRSRRQPA